MAEVTQEGKGGLMFDMNYTHAMTPSLPLLLTNSCPERIHGTLLNREILELSIS